MSFPFPPSTRIPPAPALASAALPRRVREALETVHALVFELIVDPFDRVLPEMELQLSDAERHGDAHWAPAARREAALSLRQGRLAFIARFVQNIDEELAALRSASPDAPRPIEAVPHLPSFGELRLVEEHEADEETHIRAVALRQESRAALALQLLCQRFGVLAASPAFEPGRLTPGPRRLCELMLRAAESTGFGASLRIALLREFDRVALVDYPVFAESLNHMLGHQRVMPGLSYVPLRPRPRTAQAATDAAPGSREQPHTGWTSQPAVETDAITFQLLQELLSTRRQAADRFRSPPPTTHALAHGHAPRPELETPAVVELLEQADPRAVPETFDSIRQWLLLQARQQQGQAVAMSPHDMDTFELLGLLYVHLARELREDAPAFGMLDQLRNPLLRLALSDPGFFVRATHPGRELLNAISETGAVWQGAEGTDPQLLLHLQRTVDELARPQPDLPAAFRGAVQSLEAQYQGMARRSELGERRHVEAARGKEKLALARKRSTEVIEDALRDLRLPLFHRNMLRQAWADALTLGHLRHGDESAEWQSLVQATGELARAGAGQVDPPAELQPQVEQWLATVGYHADDAGRISRILTATVQDEDDDAASRTELAMRLKARARLGEDALPESSTLPPRTTAEQAQFERVRTLPFGTWLEFDEPEGAVRRRLSWLSPVTGNVLFVNQRGQRVSESTLDTLARGLSSGTVRVVSAADGRLVDRAWRSALQSLRGLGRGSEDGETA